MAAMEDRESTRARRRAAAVQADEPGTACARIPRAEVAEVCRELLAGRWALIDRFERDGRLYIVARCGIAEARDASALTLRERQVLGRVALGHTNKLVAFDLGVSASTVATHLAMALRKLGLRSRLQVVGLLAALAHDVP